jgi:hypothetical protein
MPVKGVKGKGKARILENPTDNLPTVEKIMTKISWQRRSPDCKIHP